MKCLEATKTNAVVADADPEIEPMQDNPKDQGEVLIEIELAKWRGSGHPIFISASLSTGQKIRAVEEI